jgi:hypothetical protein
MSNNAKNNQNPYEYKYYISLFINSEEKGQSIVRRVSGEPRSSPHCTA